MSSPPGPGLSPKEAAFFATILKHNKAKLEVDWDAVLAETSYKNIASAKESFRIMLKKLNRGADAGAGVGTGADGNAGSPVPKAKAGRKKKEVGSGTNLTPSKVTKNARANSAVKPKVKKVDAEEDNENDEAQEAAEHDMDEA